jgi:hypothetical protein
VIDTSDNEVLTTIDVGQNPSSVGKFIGPALMTCLGKLVRINDGTTYYTTLSEAYAKAFSGDSLLAEAMEFSESLNLAADMSIIIRGVYECHFTSTPSWTMLKGNITIKNGTVTIDKVMIK